MTPTEKTADLAAYLRNAADEIEEHGKMAVELPTATDLRSAWAALSPLTNDLSIELRVSRYTRTSTPRLNVKVWDGIKLFEAPTIAEAVNNALKHHGPTREPKDGLDAIAEALGGDAPERELVEIGGEG